MQLNPDQQRVVDSDHHCLVVACPGSGKTRVISTKIGALLKRHPKARIAAVTFTRDSAGELTRRVAGEIGEQLLASACRIGTFHSLAIRQLRNHNRLGKVSGPQEQVQFLRRAIAATDPKMSWEDATAIIEKAKGALGPNPEKETDLYQAYQKLLAKHNVVDLYDVILNSVKWMQEGVIHPYPVQFMLVDEFQDTDALQLEWVLEHARAGTQVTVVGDDDQSIYGWRGALGFSGMQHFMDEVGAEKITLGINYRCHEEILSSADHLIQCNAQRIAKQLVAGRGPGGAVKPLRCASREDEALLVAEAIQEHCVPLKGSDRTIFEHTVPEASWAVLARGRRLLDQVENELHIRKIQYYRPPKESFWSRAPQSLILGVLSNLENGQTAGVDHALSHALTARVGKTKAANAMREVHEQFGDNLAAAFTGTDLNINPFMPDEAEVITGFLRHLQSWRTQVALGRLTLAIRGVTAWLCEFEAGDDIDPVVSAGETICKLRGTLKERVLRLQGASAQKGAPQGVQLHTMHGSKGLEFNSVWVVGCESKTIPSPKNEDFEEERRLMYVALTRAKDKLYVSSLVDTPVSDFVTEAGIITA